jgi:hypothetical protein
MSYLGDADPPVELVGATDSAHHVGERTRAVWLHSLFVANDKLRRANLPKRSTARKHVSGAPAISESFGPRMVWCCSA